MYLHYCPLHTWLAARPLHAVSGAARVTAHPQRLLPAYVYMQDSTVAARRSLYYLLLLLGSARRQLNLKCTIRRVLDKCGLEESRVERFC